MVQVLIALTPNPEEQESLNKYREKATLIRDEYGAEVVLRSNIEERMIGNFGYETVRLVKFPSIDHVWGWLNDPRYQEIIPLRDKGYKAVSVVILG